MGQRVRVTKPRPGLTTAGAFGAPQQEGKEMAEQKPKADAAAAATADKAAAKVEGAAPEAAASEALALPPMSEGVRQEILVYGRAADPFTGGLFRVDKETGALEFFARGEMDPDQPQRRI